ncbi:MAG: hypothetical protein M3Z66_25190, partial [Chloroflexota bacterium]|nr:hypothetical protein [Chloroflexota bacterium]
QLSSQVDSLLGQGSALLTGPSPLTYAQINAQLIQPLQQLESTIRGDATVARCLIDRIAAWEVATLPALFQRASATPGDLNALRQSSDLLRGAHALNLDCALGDGNAGTAVQAAGDTLLDGAVNANDWAQTVLLWRELALLDGSGATASARITTDLHAQAPGTASMSLFRAAYVLGDITDAQALYQTLSAPGSHASEMQRHPRHKHKRKRHPHPKATPAPSPTATPTPQLLTMVQLLSRGISHLDTQRVSGSPATFSWQSIPGATRYVLTVTNDSDGSLLWAWSGSATQSQYGDTLLDGQPASAGDGWSLTLPASGWHWSVLALDGQAKIVGGAFHEGN